MAQNIQRLENDQGDVLYYDEDTGEKWTEEEYGRARLIADAAEADVTEQDEIEGNIPGYPSEEWEGWQDRGWTQGNITVSLPSPTVVHSGARLAMKVARVMGDMAHVPKRGWNEHQKYWFSTESDIADMARRSMARHGLALIPTGIQDYEVKEGKTRSGNTQYLTTVSMKYRLVDGESGEYMDLEMIGTGTDTGEKGLYKAYTGAKKYLLLQLFLISTGEDDTERGTMDADPASGFGTDPQKREPRTTEQRSRAARREQETQRRAQHQEAGDKPKPSTESQHKAIYTAASTAGLDNAAVKDQWLGPVYKVESAKDLTYEQARECRDFMRALPDVETLQAATSQQTINEIAGKISGWVIQPRVKKWVERKVDEARSRIAQQQDAPSVEDEPIFSPEEEEELDRLFNDPEEEIEAEQGEENEDSE